MKRIGGTIDETPIAQIALEEDRVVEVGVERRATATSPSTSPPATPSCPRAPT